MTLKQRLEALTEPSREVDAAVRHKIFGDFAYCDADAGCFCGEFPQCSDGNGCGVELGFFDERKSYPRDWRDDEKLPHYTASLDAVIDLVERELPDAEVGLEGQWLGQPGWICWINRSQRDPTANGRGKHSLPAVALLLAFLEVRGEG